MSIDMSKTKSDIVFGDGPVAKAYLIYLTNDDSEKKMETVPVQFNPEQLSVSCGVEYKDTQGIGQNTDSDDQRPSKPEGSDLSLELYVDSASVIKNMTTAQNIDKFVNSSSGDLEMLNKLSELVDYKENTHIPFKVAFCWGKFVFKGVVTSMSTTYQLFDRDGNVVQARVSMTIRGKEEKSEKYLQSKPFESPDRTKYRNLGPVDELWMLAYEEYDDASDWRHIAVENQILNPRKLDRTKMMKLPSI